MIDCEKGCPESKHQYRGYMPNGNIGLCVPCLRGQLQKAEAENDRSAKWCALALGRFRNDEEELKKANNALEQLSQEHAATLKWYNDLRDACTTNGNTYTLKSLIAQTERLDEEIAALKAKVEAPDESLTVCDFRRCDGCSKPFDVCDLNDLAGGRMLCDYCELLERMNND